MESMAPELQTQICRPARSDQDLLAATEASGYLFAVRPDHFDDADVVAENLRSLQEAHSWSAHELMLFVQHAVAASTERCCGRPLTPLWSAPDGFYELAVYRCPVCRTEREILWSEAAPSDATS